MKTMKTTKKENENENDEEEDSKRRKTRGGGGKEEKYGRKNKSRDVGKEALNDNDENYGQRDRMRMRRGDGETPAHPLLSLTLSPYSLISLPIYHY